MTEKRENDFSVLDRPEILQCIFHPRPDSSYSVMGTGNGESFMIPVAEDVQIGACFHMASTAGPNILYFHGNGEIVSDYDQFGPVYNRMGINFIPVGYRGYGRSDGTPTVSSMMLDCHRIFEFVKEMLEEKKCSGPLFIMGRSLGSASALELAEHFEAEIDGLIIESGFAFAKPLLRLMGVNVDAIGFMEDKGFCNVDKIIGFCKPLLIIHAEYDYVIPFSDGRVLFEKCASSQKKLLMIPEAGHSDIFMIGLSDYMNAVNKFVLKQL